MAKMVMGHVVPLSLREVLIMTREYADLVHVHAKGDGNAELFFLENPAKPFQERRYLLTRTGVPVEDQPREGKQPLKYAYVATICSLDGAESWQLFERSG